MQATRTVDALERMVSSPFTSDTPAKMLDMVELVRGGGRCGKSETSCPRVGKFCRPGAISGSAVNGAGGMAPGRLSVLLARQSPRCFVAGGRGTVCRALAVCEGRWMGEKARFAMNSAGTSHYIRYDGCNHVNSKCGICSKPPVRGMILFPITKRGRCGAAGRYTGVRALKRIPQNHHQHQLPRLRQKQTLAAGYPRGEPTKNLPTERSIPSLLPPPIAPHHVSRTAIG